MGMTVREAIVTLRANAVFACERAGFTSATVKMVEDALDIIAKALQAQEPRVMTLEEVQQHYSLPPIFPDDFGMQEDYLNDIAPLYFDFPQADDSWIVHWRRYYDVADNIKEWAPSYGRKWRCWTGRPTEEQREATPWN